MQAHIYSVHQDTTDQFDRKYICPHCPKKYIKRRDVQRHIRKIHQGIKDVFACDKCDKTYPLQNTLKRHILVVHEGLKHTCTQCHKEYIEKADFFSMRLAFNFHESL